MRLKSRNVFVPAPSRPEPIEFAVQEVIDWDDLGVRGKWGVLGDKEKLKYIRSRMVHELSAALLDRLEPFIVQHMSAEGEVYRIQVTLSDRGAYENWLPAERKEGQREGFKSGEQATRARLPHGINLDRIEE